jgi:hypothetical protein
MQPGSASSLIPGPATCDAYLVSRLKDKLAGFHADDNAELLRKVQRIVTDIDRTELRQLAATNKSEYYPEL